MPSDTELTAERKLQLLTDINTSLRGTLDLDHILEQLLDSVATFIAFDAAGIFVLTDDPVVVPNRPAGRHITNIVWRGYPIRPAPDDLMLTQGRGVIGHVIRTSSPMVVVDVRLDPIYVQGREHTLSEVAVPIRIGERTIGAFNLESNQLAAFDEDDAAMLTFFAEAAALSIDKAILHRHLLEKERLEEQMHLARVVQARLLPVRPPHLPGYDIAGVCVPAYEIGGDYYDYLPLDNGCLGLAIADVSGEGVPAAMIMTAFRALLRTYSRQYDDPHQIALLLNQHLPDITGHVDFVTAFYGVLEPTSGYFTYINCGHNPPLLFRHNGIIDPLPPGGPLLSIIDDAEYCSGTTRIAPGEMLVLYTDGIVELFDEAYREYGVERLRATAARYRALSANEVLDQILSDAQRYSRSEIFYDDLTLLVVQRR